MLRLKCKIQRVQLLVKLHVAHEHTRYLRTDNTSLKYKVDEEG